jgi:uncharacterized protein (TIGR03067 family)
VGRADEPVFRAHDEFDGKLVLEWDPVRPDPTHISLEKNPGKLTITTQRGSIHGDEKNDAYGEGIQAKNLYLIPNPSAGDSDFVATTCIESFTPETNWQQAGLIVYDDDDNYLKWDLEWNQNSPAGVTIVFLRETAQRSRVSATMPEADSKKFWLRLTKRGDAYQRAFSTDGAEFIVAGEGSWGDGAPKRIGIYAKNGGNPNASEVDAVFDFFEVRSLSDAEKNDPNYVERKKLRGTWEVVSCKLGGKLLTGAPLSRFAFDGISVTIVEKTQSLKTEYALDVEKKPKGLRLSALSASSNAPVGGVYSVEDDTLTICLGLDPEAPAPTELETTQGDGRLLINLRRMTETEVAAIQRTGQSREEYFESLDKDGDDHLVLEELLVDYPTPEAVEQGTETFKLLDKNRDEKLSLDEFMTRPRKVHFLELDINADGVLSEKEFSARGSMSTASAARARRVFELIDRDGDGAMTLSEHLNRTPETWFAVFDTDEDDRVSYDEYAAGHPSLARSGRCKAVFAAIDRDSDGQLTRDELVNKPRKAFFVHMDADGDERLTFKEFTLWKYSPQQIEDAKEDFQNRDLNGDQQLTFDEFSGD